MTQPAEADLPPAQPEPLAPQPKGRAPWLVVLAGLGGLAVGALAVGGAWLANGSARDVDTQAVTLPEKIGEYVSIDQIELTKTGPGVQVAARFREGHERSSERLSQSHGGAGAATRTYSDQKMDRQYVVQVYRERSVFPLYVPYQNPADLGLPRAPKSAEQFGEVSCEISYDPSLADSMPGSDSTAAVNCVRTSDDLTVEIRPGTMDSSKPQEVVALVNEVWNAVA